MSIKVELLVGVLREHGELRQKAIALMETLTKAKEAFDRHGICVECGEMYSHWLHEPFASCGCKQTEWSIDYTPYMTLEVRNQELGKALTTSYDLVAESLVSTPQYDYRARATAHVRNAENILKKGEFK